MRILLVGAGGVGTAFARIAARRPFAELIIADYDLARAQRAAAAGGARLVIDEEVARFLTESRAHDAGPAIRALRLQADGIRSQTVEQAQRLLAAGKSADEVIEYLANTLTNRLLHTPTQALRQAAALADSALAEAITRLLIEERDRH